MKPFRVVLRCLSACLLVIGGTLSLQAQTSTARFLLWNCSARSTSMGNTGTGASGNPFAAYYNPAGLAGLNDISFSAFFTRPDPFSAGTGHGFISFAKPFGRQIAAAVSLNYIHEDVGVVTRYDPTPLAEDPGRASWEAKASLAIEPRPGLSVGGSVGVLRMTLADFDIQDQGRTGVATTMIADLGIQWGSLLPQASLVEPEDASDAPGDLAWKTPGITLAVALRNIGSRIAFIDNAQSDPLPLLLCYGFEYHPVVRRMVTLTAALEVEKETRDAAMADYVRTGAEIIVANFLALRGGYSFDTYGVDQSYGSYGAGVHYRFATFNIARVKQFYLPTWQFELSVGKELW